jgi:hypothetical protein
MAATAEQIEDIDAALQFWRQGDVTLDAGLEFLHLADLSIPLSPASQRAAKSIIETDGVLSADLNALLDEVPGLVILSQTCDIVRSCEHRPFVEVAPLAEMQPDQVEAVRRLRRPAFVYVPAVADRGLVGDLDRIMTVEKSIVAHWQRIPGWDTDDEARSLAEAVARKWARFAFPDDFNNASAELRKRLTTRHEKDHAEGAHLRALREIRVRAAPSWDDEAVRLAFWFIKETEPAGHAPAWDEWVDEWSGLFQQSTRFTIEAAVACRLEDITGQDYVESDRLDLDQLSSRHEAPPAG